MVLMLIREEELHGGGGCGALMKLTLRTEDGRSAEAPGD
jgi:hypothetical protein